MSKLTENLTRELKESHAIYGSKVTLKQLKNGNVEKIYVTLDCPLEIEQKLEGSKASASIIKLDMTKDILKELCKVPFNVSVLSILKEEIKKKAKEEKTEEKKRKRREKGK